MKCFTSKITSISIKLRENLDNIFIYTVQVFIVLFFKESIEYKNKMRYDQINKCCVRSVIECIVPKRDKSDIISSL